jgi:uncharacterized protein YbjT (DUF2867 family)
MSTTILVVGATGNTGRTATQNLSAAVAGTKTRILALSRSVDSAAAVELAKLLNVEVEGKNWVEIDAEWLKARNVSKVRLFPPALPFFHSS